MGKTTFVQVVCASAARLPSQSAVWGILDEVTVDHVKDRSLTYGGREHPPPRPNYCWVTGRLSPNILPPIPLPPSPPLLPLSPPPVQAGAGERPRVEVGS